MSPRLTLPWVVALIAMFAIGAPTALAADPPDQSGSSSATPGAANGGSVSQGADQPVANSDANAQQGAVNEEVPGAPPDGGSAGQGVHNEATSEASNGVQVDQTTEQQQLVEGSEGGGIAQSQQLEQNAQVDQEAESQATTGEDVSNLGDPGGVDQEPDNDAQSEASNEAEIEQGAEQQQVGDGGSGGAGSSQVQQAEQSAEINQDSNAQATGEQQATNSAPPVAAPPAAEVEWSALLSQMPLAGGVEEILAITQNGSLVLQAIWQVQNGCNNHCTGTSQSQSATQNASTTQNATAVAAGGALYEGGSSGGGAPPATADARNESVTIQFVWQTQIGCVAFCVETTQTQAATQWAQTIQSAAAEGDMSAVAQNLSRTIQLVWQLQEGCREECYGTSQVQVINQGKQTTQSATATSGAGPPTLGADGAVVLPGWLVALAQNLGVTIQTIYQLQEAVCAEYCEGDSQVQEAQQEADVSQDAAARAGASPPEEPPTEQPPTGQPPTTQPPAAQAGPAQPAARPDAAAALAAIRDPSSPASRRLRSQLIELASHGRESKARSLVLVLPPAGHTRPSKPSAIIDEPLTTAFTTIASDSATRRSQNPAGARDSDPVSSATLGVTPDSTNGGGGSGWLWIALLAASLALLPALRRVAR
jgi:hypothetical protein